MSREPRTIDGQLVHKHAASEVFVTDIAGDARGWVMGVRLPRQHAFYSDMIGRQSGHHDPLLVLEALRQGCIAASHVFYRVPEDFRFLLRHYQFNVIDMAALEKTSESADVELRAAITREFRRGPEDTVSGLAVAATASTRGVRTMELSIAFQWVPESRWREMRAGAAQATPLVPTTVDPAIVGRGRSANVAIAAPIRHLTDKSVSASIVVDTSNRTFFDHPLDHLPGSLILEACRQLAVAAMGSHAQSVLGPSRMRCDFQSFAELDPPCLVTLTPSPDGVRFQARVTQSGYCRTTADLAFAAPDSP